MKKILVVGSLNMDLVTVCKKAAIGGETIFGKDFFNSPGGKGANQAVAISKMGSNTYMLGMVGADNFGKQLKNNLKANGIMWTMLQQLISQQA